MFVKCINNIVYVDYIAIVVKLALCIARLLGYLIQCVLLLVLSDRGYVICISEQRSFGISCVVLLTHILKYIKLHDVHVNH